MSLRTFFSFVELKTKIASIVPFFTGVAYAFYTSGEVNLNGTLLFFAAMILFDMTTTAINNFIDSRSGGGARHYSDAVSLAIIFVMGSISAAIGVYLSSLYGVVVLGLGVICFAVGVLYTFGPFPISRTPYGELFSGIIMGFFITYLIVFINLPSAALVDAEAVYPILRLSIDVASNMRVALLSVPLVCGIANIMLANNICDVPHDITVKRYTLPYYIGTQNSLRLFAALNALAYGSVLLSVVLRIIPAICLITLATAIPVVKNTKAFMSLQTKSGTFALSVANLVLLSVPYFSLIFIGGMLR